MTSEPIVVTLSRDIEDLVPVFLAQRKSDQTTLKDALPARDFAAIRWVGHAMAGAGASYGFDYLSIVGECLVKAARADDIATLDRLCLEFDDYMARLVVKYV